MDIGAMLPLLATFLILWQKASWRERIYFGLQFEDIWWVCDSWWGRCESRRINSHYLHSQPAERWTPAFNWFSPCYSPSQWDGAIHILSVSSTLGYLFLQAFPRRHPAECFQNYSELSQANNDDKLLCHVTCIFV